MVFVLLEASGKTTHAWTCKLPVYKLSILHWYLLTPPGTSGLWAEMPVSLGERQVACYAWPDHAHMRWDAVAIHDFRPLRVRLNGNPVLVCSTVLALRQVSLPWPRRAGRRLQRP